MAYKPRWFHLVVGILVIHLLVYSFYTTSTVSFRNRNEDISNFSKTASPSPVSALISKTANSKMAAVIHTIMLKAIQKIPPELSSKLQAARNSGGNKIITRTLYASGFKSSRIASCTDEGHDLKMLIAITSTPSHNEARMAIRLTWGYYALQQGVKILFFLGKVSDLQLSNVLDEEDKLYGDLVRAEFLDSYNNLTLKTVSILDWTYRFCSSVRFLLKTDDDMFINVPKLLSFTKKHSEDNNIIFGRLARKWKPVRAKSSKYYVSPQEYGQWVYPDFTTGPAYLLTGDVIHSLFEAALNSTYLKLEDVFITGIVADQIKVKRVQANEFLNDQVSLHACTIQKIISIHRVTFQDQFDIWKYLWDSKSKCKI